MAKQAFRRATALASVLQILMVLLGSAVPSLQSSNLYPILGTLLAVLAGFLFALWAPGRVIKPALVGGALAGGISGFLGILLAWALGQMSLPTVAIATVTSVGAGAVGGFFGRLFGDTPAAA